MQTQLLELKNEIMADVVSMKRSIFAAFVAVTIAQATLIVCALIFLKH